MYPHEDAVVLSYFDSQITVKDVASLKPRCWLTDNIINFYVEYVEQTMLRPKISGLHEKVAVIGPSVVQMLKFLNTNEFSALDCLKLQSKRLILLPLNDAAINDQGSHWSLLVYVKMDCKKEPVFFHLDSLNGRNNATCLELCPMLSQYLCGQELYPESPAGVGQQSNMFDCGIMVILFIEHILHFYAEKQTLDDNWEKYKFGVKQCHAKRHELLKLVEELHEKEVKGAQ